jgi:hypothetical protein
MTFREAVATCFRKYADFGGRASRSEYWWFSLLQALVAWPTFGGMWVLIKSGHAEAGMGLFAGLCLTFWLPSWAVTVRRRHDAGRSGWTLKPFEAFERGDPWPSRYGPPPGEHEPGEQPSTTSAPTALHRVIPMPGAPARRAVFVPCPGCGRQINQDAGRCPHCRADVPAAHSRDGGGAG